MRHRCSAARLPQAAGGRSRALDAAAGSRSLIVCLGQIYERWDGKGLPRKLKGDDVAPAVQLVTLAQDAVVWNRVGDGTVSDAGIVTTDGAGAATVTIPLHAVFALTSLAG